MPSRKDTYVNMEKFRKTRNAQRKKYYDKTALYTRNSWTKEQDQAVLEHSITDSELSKIIGHSVNAIQSRRSKLKKSQKRD